MSNTIRIIVAFAFVVNAGAQLPHEVLVLANRKSPASLRAANTFVAAREIPKRNVVYLDIPAEVYGGTATITPRQFTELIWNPVTQIVKERTLEGQILAWIYSVDFPIRVKTDASDRKQMSVAGLTFMRNTIPDLSMVEEGKYLSQLFLGPNETLNVNLNTMDFGILKEGVGTNLTVPAEAAYLQSGLGDRMPLPSMMLGYVGENGNEIETVLDCIQRGVRSDYKGIRGGIYFMMSDDVRSTCREWQFYPAVNELKKRHISANITTNLPTGKRNIMGLMMGAEQVDSSALSFAPGAMAEHLTSWSAEFQRPQTKMTAWIKAGATGSAGAVVEPYSNPNKFPSARFYVHYTSGCTMLESFYLSIACPLQTLLLGDPLAKPYALPMSIKLLGADTLTEDFTYIAKAESPVDDVEYRYAFLLDGKMIQGFSEDPSVYLRSNQLSDGYHELCAMAQAQGRIRFNVSVTKAVQVDRLGRSLKISPDIRKVGPRQYGIKIDLDQTNPPEKLRLVSGEMVVDEKKYDPDAELVIDELLLGEGPNRVRAVAVFEDGMEVSSFPVNFDITFKSDS